MFMSIPLLAFLLSKRTSVPMAVGSDFIFSKCISWLKTLWALPTLFMQATKCLQRQQL